MIGRHVGFAVALLFSLSTLPSNAQLRIEEGVDRLDTDTTGVTAVPLLYALPMGIDYDVEHQLDFLVTEGKVLKLKESLGFTLASDSEVARPVIEVLPLHPKFLSHLREDGANENTLISVYLDGNLLDEDTLSELARKTQELRRENVFFVDVEGRPTNQMHNSLPSLSKSGASCVYQCDTTFRACGNFCLSRPILNCEENCESRYRSCLRTCGCPVIINEWTNTTYLSDTLVSPLLECLSDYRFYQKYTRTYRNERFQKLVQCDGISTIVSVGVYYTEATCYKRVANAPSCIFPNPNLPPIGLLCIIN